MKKLLLAVLAVSGCAGSGTLTVTAYGEEFIEEEIPAEEFEDGFKVHFTKFLVTIKGFKADTKTGDGGPSQSSSITLDVSNAGPHTVQQFTRVEAKKYDAVSWTIAPASDGDNSVEVEGELTDGDGNTKTFAWVFDTATEYSECASDELGEGVTVTADGDAEAQLTIHGDHLFYDDLQAADAKLRGQALFDADSDDNVITLEELNAVQLTSLPASQYGTGGADVTTLGAFVRAQVRSLGHFQGEGHCHTHSL